MNDEMYEAEFTVDEATAIIWWLLHLLGDRVTIPKDAGFWDDNLPEAFRVMVDADSDGNAVLVAQKVDWQ